MSMPVGGDVPDVIQAIHEKHKETLQKISEAKELRGKLLQGKERMV
ncbi:MAG: hypothetical protein GF334_07935 [Candidatus Altiarchaeales archaeon]|nr:hypothetical protein [Candidatus Altiarchaeales archaeon]